MQNPSARPQISASARRKHHVDVVGQLGNAVARGLHDVPECLGQELVVAAVRAVDEVIGGEVEDRPDRTALLADARVGGPVHQAVGGEVQDVLLEDPDPHGLHQHQPQIRGGGVIPVGVVVASSTHGDAGVNCFFFAMATSRLLDPL